MRRFFRNVLLGEEEGMPVWLALILAILAILAIAIFNLPSPF
jgi:hypothetical protein